jgi:hypothetical protein
MADSSDLTITEGVFRRIKREQVSNHIEIRGLSPSSEKIFPGRQKIFRHLRQNGCVFRGFLDRV